MNKFMKIMIMLLLLVKVQVKKVCQNSKANKIKNQFLKKIVMIKTKIKKSLNFLEYKRKKKKKKKLMIMKTKNSLMKKFNLK